MGIASHACFLGLSLQDKPHRRAQDKKRNELGESAAEAAWGRMKSGFCLSDSLNPLDGQPHNVLLIKP